MLAPSGLQSAVAAKSSGSVSAGPTSPEARSTMRRETPSTPASSPGPALCTLSKTTIEPSGDHRAPAVKVRSRAGTTTDTSPVVTSTCSSEPQPVRPRATVRL